MNTALYLLRIAFLTIAICTIANAVKSNTGDSISFKRISYNEGLSQNSVISIYQDQQGFIWFGTLGGLNKYNGYELEVYQNNLKEPSTLNSDRIYDIAEDASNTLWIATIQGLNRYDPSTDSFFQHPDLENTSVHKLFLDSFGNFWVGSENGLFLYDINKDEFRSYQPTNPSKYEDPLNIHSLYEDSHHILWIGMESGLQWFDLNINQFITQHPYSKEFEGIFIRSITQDKFGNTWIGSEQEGVFQINQETKEIRHFVQNGKEGLPSNMVRKLFPTESGEIWIGTREGLFIYNILEETSSVLKYNKYDPFSLGHNSIRDIYRDDTGNIWVGTYSGGVSVLYPNTNNFKHYGESMGNIPGLNHPVVSSLTEDSNGNLWVGTEGGGVNFLDQATGEYQYFTQRNNENSLLHNNVKALLLDDDNLWVGTVQGLNFFDTKRKKFYAYRQDSNKPNSLSSNEIYCLAKDGDDGIWIGTNDNGLNYLSKKTNSITSTYTAGDSDTSLTSNNIRVLLTEENGNLWIGSGPGLNYFDVKENCITPYRSEKYSNGINALYKDAFGILWIGTQGSGIILLDTKSNKLYHLVENQDLSNLTIYGILEDEDGYVWASTNHGVSKIYLPEREKGINLANTEIINYGRQDGVKTEQFNLGGFFKASNGTMYFSGINGITYFNPDNIFKNTSPPRIAFTSFKVMNQPMKTGDNSILTAHINVADEINLKYDHAYFSISFAALNYISSSKNQYMYKLEGLKNGDIWQELGNKRVLTFNNLVPGDYVLKVKASNNDGVWSMDNRQIAIHVRPPFWKTPWAYMLYVLVLVLALYLFYFFSLKIAKLKQKLSYETLIHEKEQELYHSKLQFFTNVSHEIKTPLTLILAPIEKLIKLDEGNNRIHNQLMMMQRNGERLLKLINQLLDFRKFETGHSKLLAAEGNVVKFIREVCLSFDQYALHKNIEFEFSTVEESISIWFDRDKLEKILFNLLSNAFKFTPEHGRIQVLIKKDKNTILKKSYILIDVIDNGKGIALEDQSKIFERFSQDNKDYLDGTGIGLSYAKGLVELHGGNITVKSKPAAAGAAGYTCLSIRLPIGKGHLTADQLHSGYKSSEDIQHYFDKTLVKDKKEAKVNANLTKQTMLIVEDYDELRYYLCDHFKEFYQVIEAKNGEEGKVLAFKHLPDIIISDVMMPKENGINLCKILKNDIRTSHIPIILLTARTPLIFKIEGFETGADDYITKPFHIDVLDTRIRNLIQSRQRLRQRFKTEMTLQPTDIAVSSPDERFLKSLLSYIEENMGNSELRVNDICKAVAMSRTHLHRKVKALTNMSISELIRNIRLKRAAQILEQGSLNISEVAYTVGFRDPDYFRKCFKNQFAVTPSSYQKNGSAINVSLDKG